MSPFPQVLGGEGVRELWSSASTLLHSLEESASLLTTFWRAALPSSSGPAPAGPAVRGQCPSLGLPTRTGGCSASSAPQIQGSGSQWVVETDGSLEEGVSLGQGSGPQWLLSAKF